MLNLLARAAADVVAPLAGRAILFLAEDLAPYYKTSDGVVHPLVGPQGIQGEKGEQGIQGIQGDAGPPGVGVPAGGIAGQFVQKTATGTQWAGAVDTTTDQTVGGVKTFTSISNWNLSANARIIYGEPGGDSAGISMFRGGWGAGTARRGDIRVRTGDMLLGVGAASDNSAPVNWVIVVIESTAYGAAGDFYERCKTAIELDRQIRAGTAKLTAMDYRFHFYPWFRDPINELDPDGVTLTAEDEAYFAKVEAEMNYTLRPEQKAWYVKKAAEQRDKMKREHPSTPEEAFQASTEGAYYGKEMAAADSSGRITDLPINPQVPIHTFWDIGRSDATSIWFMQENGPWLDFVDFYENSGFGVAHYAKVLKERGYLYGKHYWPHDGANEDWSANENRVQVAGKLGIKPIVVVPRINDITEGIDMVRNMLPRCRFDRVRCGPPKAGEGRGGLEALRRYTKVWNDKTETYSDLPFHNWASNPADAFRQVAQGYVSSSGRRVGESRGMANDNWRTA